MRFTSYQFQVNLFAIATMAYFGPYYRQHDTLRQDVFLDSRDLEQIQFMAVVGALALIPSVSSVMNYLAQNHLELVDGRIEPNKKCAPL